MSHTHDDDTAAAAAVTAAPSSSPAAMPTAASSTAGTASALPHAAASNDATSSSASSSSSSAASAPPAAASSASSSASPAAAAAAAAAHVHDDYSARHCPRPPSLHPKLDLHTHILPEHLPDLAKRYGYGEWVSLRHGAENGGGSSGCGGRSCCAAMYKGDRFFRQVEANCFRAEERIKDMDEQHINVQVLSTVPVMFSYQAKPEDTLDLARYLNDHIAGVVRQHPTRFVGLGTIPMQSVEHAIPELRRCMLELGMAGVQIGSHVNQLMLGDPKLFPIFEEAERLGACIFVHPWDMAGEAMMRKYWLPWLVGMPMESSAAICSMMLSGMFRKLPNLRVCFAHGGGSFPGTIGRIEHGWHCRPDLVAIDTPERSPRQWMGHFWLDSLTHDATILSQIVALVGPERVVFGTDYPFPLGEIHMGSLIAHMDDPFPPPEHPAALHSKEGAAGVAGEGDAAAAAEGEPSPLHPDERAKWTTELKGRLLWRNGLEFLGLEHAEERFMRTWTPQPHPFDKRALLKGQTRAAAAAAAVAPAESEAVTDALSQLALASSTPPSVTLSAPQAAP